ncbi:sensor histidine kinase [Marinicella sp. W31]|uniref:sensor histidine kinase n=1 Tax=Marinicella sp. W31 TaxID=3023713 RepID=UPI003757205F
MRQNWLANLCDSLHIFTVIVVTQMVVLIYSLSFLSLDYLYFNQISIISLLAQLIAISLVIVFCKLRPWLNRLQVHLGLLLVVLIILMISTLYTQMVGWLDSALGFGLLEDSLLLNIKISVASTLTFLLLLRYFYIQAQWQKQIEAASRSQMNALQARIKPHFLYNSMNSIAAMISIDAVKAEQAVEHLSNLFRRAFSHRGPTILLSQELDWVEQYLSIEKLRFQERLSYAVNIEETSILTYELPVLCIQPLVENAILHGIQHLPEGGHIDVEVSSTERALEIRIKNPYDPTSVSAGTGIGINNIKSRLQLTYANKAGLQIDASDNMYEAVLTLPL